MELFLPEVWKEDGKKMLLFIFIYSGSSWILHQWRPHKCQRKQKGTIKLEAALIFKCHARMPRQRCSLKTLSNAEHIFKIRRQQELLANEQGFETDSLRRAGKIKRYSHPEVLMCDQCTYRVSKKFGQPCSAF